MTKTMKPTRFLLPFTQSIDMDALASAVWFAKRCQATLIPLALIPLTKQQWKKGPRLEAIEQANDFLEAVKYKAARVGVLVEPYEMCTSDVVHSISWFARKMKCEGILLFPQNATTVLLPPAVVKRLLRLATSKRSVVRLPPTDSPGHALLLLKRYPGWRRRWQGHREEVLPLQEHSLSADGVVTQVKRDKTLCSGEEDAEKGVIFQHLVCNSERGGRIPTMTKTSVAYPIVAALVAAEQMEGMGPGRQWQPANDTQQHFLEHYFNLCRDEVTGIPEIESLASWSCETIRAFLRKRGFTLQLQPFGYPGFGVASVLDLFVIWAQQGEARVVRGVDSHDYPAVRIDRKGVEFYQAEQKHPIAALKTTIGDRVCLTMLDDEPSHEFDIDHQAEELSQHMGHPTNEYNGAIFPMVDLDQQVDIRWLLKLSTRAENGDHVEVKQALQQNILKINEVGARAKSAVAMEFLPTAALMHTEPDLVINAPFLLWFERPGLEKPLFTGYITQEHWRNPGNLAEG